MLVVLLGRSCAPGTDLPSSKFSCANIHRCSRVGGPVFYVRAALNNMQRVVELAEEGDEYGDEKLVLFLTFAKERCYLICDKETRKTRRLTKMLACQDLANVGFSNIYRPFMAALGESSKLVKAGAGGAGGAGGAAADAIPLAG